MKAETTGPGGGELDDALDGGVAADRAEGAPDVDVGAVGVQRVRRAAEVGVERRVDDAGGGVEGEDPVADQVVAGVGEGVGGLTEVNVPAAMILLPTWVIALTEPFMTCGVKSAGLAETTRLPWSALTALPCGANATSESVVAAPIAAARRWKAVCTGSPQGQELAPNCRLRGR